MIRFLVACLLLLSSLPLAQGQALPWRAQVEKRLEHQERLLEILLQQRPQYSPPAPLPTPIIIADPRQLLPIEGSPKQQLPLEGSPKQQLPLEGSPKQQLPLEGSPKQQLPPEGGPRQEFPWMPPASTSPQAYTFVPALWRTR